MNLFALGVVNASAVYNLPAPDSISELSKITAEQTETEAAALPSSWRHREDRRHEWPDGYFEPAELRLLYAQGVVGNGL